MGKKFVVFFVALVLILVPSFISCKKPEVNNLNTEVNNSSEHVSNLPKKDTSSMQDTPSKQDTSSVQGISEEDYISNSKTNFPNYNDNISKSNSSGVVSNMSKYDKDERRSSVSSKYLLESWELNDGGTSDKISSACEGGTPGLHRWGVWIKNNTFGRSLDFSTEGSYAKVSDTKANFNKEFSLSVWVIAPPREDKDRVILYQGKDDKNYTKLYLDSQNNFELIYESTGVTGLESSGVSLTDGLWHHIGISRSGEDFAYYIDGKKVKQLKVDNVPTCKSQDIYIGSDADFKNGFDGTVAQLRIFSKSLSPSEMTETVPDKRDNKPARPRLNLKRGLVIDRRQYYSPKPMPHEGQTVREQDIINTKNMGFDHVKLLLTPNHLIAEDGSLIRENMFYINDVVEYVRKNNYVCILCLHPEGNFKPKYLGNLKNFEKLIKWYGEFAKYIKENWEPDMLALQLMTEPGSNNSTVSWSWMSDRMWGAVRNVLPEHTLLTSSDQYGNIERLKLMSPASDSNLVYTFTTYEPYTIGWYYYGTKPDVVTLWGYIKDIPYPVEEGFDYSDAIENAIELVPESQKAPARTRLKAYVDGICDGERTEFKNNYDSLYNAQWHMLRAKSLDDWRKKYGGNIHIMCVEFGCMDRLTPVNLWHSAVEGSGIPDSDRLLFVHDMRKSFDAYNIGWSYWSYNEAHTIFLPSKHVYGESPMPETAKNMFDYEMLDFGLGVTPLFDIPQWGVASTDIILGKMDSLYEGWVGFPSQKIGTSVSPAEGRGYLEVTSNTDIVFMRNLGNFDLSDYDKGTLHLSVYVSNPTVIKEGQIELSSSGTCDKDEFNFGEFGKNIILNKGWNNLSFSMKSAKKIGNPDLSSINYMRIYFVVSGGTTTVGVDNFYVALPKK